MWQNSKRCIWPVTFKITRENPLKNQQTLTVHGLCPFHLNNFTRWVYLDSRDCFGKRLYSRWLSKQLCVSSPVYHVIFSYCGDQFSQHKKRRPWVCCKVTSLRRNKFHVRAFSKEYIGKRTKIPYDHSGDHDSKRGKIRASLKPTRFRTCL